MSRKIFDLKQVKSVREFGAKAVNLNRLLNWGFNVPLTKVLCASAFERKIVRLPELKTLKANWLNESADLQELLQKIQNHILTLELEFDLKAELEGLIEQWQARGISYLAVRSSALSEDSQTHSYAGQFSTVLNVPIEVTAIWTAIKKVWASMFEPGGWQYILKHQLNFPELGMAVILQEMLAAEFAGVAFSGNPEPTGNNELIIEYVQGLGEQLVSGQVTPQQLKIDPLKRDDFLSENFSVKNLNGFVEEILRLEKLAGEAVDVEWAYANQQFYFLQFRPVTTLKNTILWTRENVGEVIPDVVTPFSWSILEPMTNNAYHFFLKRAGIRLAEKRLFTVYHGLVYFNHNAYQKLINSFYLSNYLIKGRSKWQNGLSALKFGWLLTRLLNFSRQLPGKIQKVLNWQEKKFREFRQTQKSLKPGQSLRQIIKILNTLMKIHVSATILAELYYQLLDKFCHETFKNKEVDASKLLQGIGQVESVKPTLALWEIAHWISENERYRNIFITKEADELMTWWQNLPETDVLKKELNLFIEGFGYAALHEFEISYPRWREDLNYIFNTLKSYVSAADGYYSMNKQYKQTEADRRKMIKIFQQELEKDGKKVRKFLFNHLLNKAEYFSFYRESLKQKILKWLDFLRQQLILISFQYFDNKEDIFFVRIEELRQIFANKLQKEDVLFLVKQRKAEREKYLREPQPFRIKQIGQKWLPVFEEEKSGHALVGLPCSAGIAEGRACVVLDAQTQSNQFMPGDILITRATNPGWTPLMAMAGGIVTEIGGALSHGAIIAREFSIPMVAAVKDATLKIRTGQWIKVNGQTGTVEILKEVVQ